MLVMDAKDCGLRPKIGAAHRKAVLRGNIALDRLRLRREDECLYEKEGRRECLYCKTVTALYYPLKTTRVGLEREHVPTSPRFKTPSRCLQNTVF